MTQEALAKAAGVATTTVRNIEEHRSQERPRRLDALAQALGVEPAAIDWQSAEGKAAAAAAAELARPDLRELREARQLSATDLARKAGVSWKVVARAEGGGKITEHSAGAIAAALGVAPDAVAWPGGVKATRKITPLLAQPGRICGHCGRPFTPYDARDRRRHCSPECERRSRHRVRVAKTPLAQFLYDGWRSSGLTQVEYAGRMGLTDVTLYSLIRGGLPGERAYEQLRAAFGDDLPKSETLAERRKRAFAGHRERTLAALHSPEAVQKSAARRRGLRQSAEAIAKRVAARRGGQAWRRRNAALAAKLRTPTGRALQALYARLRDTPRPTRWQLATWARATAARTNDAAAEADLTPGAVMTLWRPALQERGLATPRGRRPLEDRHQQLAALMREAERTARGRLPEGFWTAAHAAIAATEGARAPADYDALRRWYKLHRRSCPHHYDGERPAPKRRQPDRKRTA